MNIKKKVAKQEPQQDAKNQDQKEEEYSYEYEDVEENPNDGKKKNDEKNANQVEDEENQQEKQKKKAPNIEKLKDEREKDRTLDKKKTFAKEDKLSIIQKYDMNDSNDPLNQKLIPLNEFKGPLETRRITNKISFLFFIVLNVAYLMSASYVITLGAIERLSNGQDFRSEVCGYGKYVDRPYLYFLTPTRDINVAFCVSSCPISTGKKICIYDEFGQTYAEKWTKFCYTQMASIYLGKYCVQKEPLNRAAVESRLDSVRWIIKRLASDLSMSIDLIIIGILITIGLSYSIQVLLRTPRYVKFLIWGCVWGSLVCFASISYLCYLEYERTIKYRCLFGLDKHNCGGTRAQFFTLMCWVIAGLGGFYLLVVIKLFNRINLSIGFIKASAKVASVIHQIRFLPFLVSFFAFCCGLLTIITILYALTVGDVIIINVVPGTIDGNRVKIITYNALMTTLIFFNIYVFLTWMLFVLGFNSMYTSYAISLWFFSKKKDTVQIPLSYVFKLIFFNHTGTVVMQILIQPIITIPKMLLSSIVYTLRSLPQQSSVVRWMQGCCFCCIHLYQVLFRYISAHSLIQTAIWGDPFFTSTKKSFFLIERHKEKIQDLDFLIGFLILQIKLCCSLIPSVLVYVYIAFAPFTPIVRNDIKLIETPILPAGVLFIMSFFFTAIFQGTFDMTCKAIIQCYFIDYEMFWGEQRFVEKFIRDFMEFYNKEDKDKFKTKSKKQVVLSKKIKMQELQQFYDKPALQDDDDEKQDNEKIQEEPDTPSEHSSDQEDQDEEYQNQFAGDDDEEQEEENKEEAQDEEDEEEEEEGEEEEEEEGEDEKSDSATKSKPNNSKGFEAIKPNSSSNKGGKPGNNVFLNNKKQLSNASAKENQNKIKNQRQINTADKNANAFDNTDPFNFSGQNKLKPGSKPRGDTAHSKDSNNSYDVFGKPKQNPKNIGDLSFTGEK